MKTGVFMFVPSQGQVYDLGEIAEKDWDHLEANTLPEVWENYHQKLNEKFPLYQCLDGRNSVRERVDHLKKAFDPPPKVDAGSFDEILNSWISSPFPEHKAYQKGSELILSQAREVVVDGKVIKSNTSMREEVPTATIAPEFPLPWFIKQMVNPGHYLVYQLGTMVSLRVHKLLEITQVGCNLFIDVQTVRGPIASIGVASIAYVISEEKEKPNASPLPSL